MDDDKPDVLEMTSKIIAAYVSRNTIIAENLPNLIATVHEALKHAAFPAVGQPTEELKPAVPVKKSVQRDYIICLEDGKKFKSLKRHLRTHYNLSPEEYRQKWRLPLDYPMVAPTYAANRSELARTMGLGQRRKLN